jgi:predicted HicB family RNase H-like nuclease
MEAQGEAVPQPLAERSFSGKLNLRLGPELHRRVALDAAEAGMSINTWVACRVS